MIIGKKIKSFLRNNIDFKVSFIICGTQKGGTTALDYYLRKHVEICMANKKEVHFFDNDSLFKNNKNKVVYTYLITPKGISEKTKLTIKFMKLKMREYDELKKELIIENKNLNLKKDKN